MKNKSLLLFASILLIFAEPLYSQIIRKPIKIQKEQKQSFSLNVGMVFTTQYLWRGMNLANSPAFEPYGKFKFWDFELDLRGVYGMNTSIPNKLNADANAVNFSEVQLGLNFTLPTEVGDFSLGLRDYIFPYLKIEYVNDQGQVAYKAATYFNFQSKGTGSHTLEANVRYDGPQKVPVWLFFASNVYNDPYNSWYLEGGSNFYISNENFMIFAGFTHGPSRWYQIMRPSIGELRSVWGAINLGLGWKKVIPLSGSVSLPVNVNYVYNAFIDNYYLVFNIGIDIGE